MSNKNVHYKIDFKIERSSDKGNLSFKNFRKRWYWSGQSKWGVPFLENIVASFYADNKITTLVPPNTTPDDIFQYAAKASVLLSGAESKDFFKYIQLGRADWYNNLKNSYGIIPYGLSANSSEKYDAILHYLASLTPEYQECEAQFQKWIAKRPGLRQIWDDIYEGEPTLIDFAKAAIDSKFRSKVENARPRTLKIGTLVQLRERHVNNRSKDPFYWADESVKNSPRLGMISAFYEDHAYGYGSRQLKIMWIANSEETVMMERDLKILSD